MSQPAKISASLLLTAAVAGLFLFSLRYRFLDIFVIGAWHGNLGADFFSIPRSFLNLTAGHSMFDTAYTEYGPYATAFFFHPAVSLLFGSWLSLFEPWTAYVIFVLLSLVVLGYSASLFARDLRAAYPLIICSFPVYLMLWNAQLHVFTVLASCLVLAGLLDLGNGAERPGGAKICAGLLVSLLTKPLLLLVIPYLLLVKRARRATILALVCYAAVSALFIVVPVLNPQGDNLTHWTNIVRESTKINFTKGELFSLPTYLNLLAGGGVPGQLFKLPLLLAFLPLLAVMKIRGERERVLLVILGTTLLLSAYYLAYTTVWEYHYATLFTIVPALLILVRSRDLQVHPVSRWVGLAALAFLYLPTPCFLFRHKLVYIYDWITFCRSFRVLPAMVIYGVLFFATVGFIRRNAATTIDEIP